MSKHDFAPLVAEYLANLAKAASAPGAAPELSLRPSLEHLLSGALKLFERDPRFNLSHEATTAGVKGRPDFILYCHDSPVGYIEAESIEANLRKLTGHAKHQNDHYTKNLDNFLLTNHLDFELWSGGKRVQSASLPDPREAVASPSDSEVHKLTLLLDQFFGSDKVTLPPLKAPRDLAQALARRTRQLNESIHYSLQTDPGSYLHKLKKSFEAELLPNLNDDEFADLYAQTVSYGLFAARCAIQNDGDAAEHFDRLHATEFIPASNPFLAELFSQITSRKLSEDIRWITDDIARLLKAAPYVSVRPHSQTLTKRQDPVIHFYETFLAAYDPKLRESRGVYYTPEPVVSYIVRSVDELLKDRLGRKNGLSDDSVKILDPATGTGTFLAQTILHIYQQFEDAGNVGLFSPDYIEQKLLPRLFGFELMVAPYTIAHLKLHLLLKDLCPAYNPEKRLEIYLTNTLEPPQVHPELAFAEYISKENNQAAQIKGNEDILVIIGNPPYSGTSANKGEDIKNLLHGIDPVDPKKKDLPNYYKYNGKPLGEKKLWLDNDYVKFIRFSQWRIDRTGEGILAFITDNGYLDNPTFRGMRQALMKSFSEIHILDLHGNSRKKELNEETGQQDGNVFDIQQGVSIILAIRTKTDKPDECKVFHHELFGPRKGSKKTVGKFDFLCGHDVSNTNWVRIEPENPRHYFVPPPKRNKKAYEKFVELDSILELSCAGIITARDGFVSDISKHPLYERLLQFVDLEKSDESIRSAYFRGKGAKQYPDGDTRSWKIPHARNALIQEGILEVKFQSFIYSPFDIRTIYWSDILVDWPRTELTPHLLNRANLSIVTSKQTKDTWGALVMKDLPRHKSCAAYDVNYVFPLYLYPSEDSAESFDPESYRRPNFSDDFLKSLARALSTKRVLSKNVNDHALAGMIPATKDGEKLPLPYDESGQYFGLPKGVSPEDIFHYLYAVLHSPDYRERYKDFLKIDFPRIPLPGSRVLFDELIPLGQQLVSLHLLDTDAAPVLLEPRHPFPNQGSNIVHDKFGTKKFPGWENSTVFLNEEQTFENVPAAVWNHTIGGYQPPEKWLKDRRERTLATEDIQHYQHMLIAIAETQTTMSKIDLVISTHGCWPNAFTQTSKALKE